MVEIVLNAGAILAGLGLLVVLVNRDRSLMRSVLIAVAVWLVLYLIQSALTRVTSAQESTHWAYTLEDQNEPEYLALRTQYGTFRILRSDEWGCGYLYANQNVYAEFQDQSVILTPDGEGWRPSCTAMLVAQMDEMPCFANDYGDCDVAVENN